MDNNSETIGESLLGLSLPPRIKNEKDGPYGAQYGAKAIAAKYCGFRNPPLIYNLKWQHGWMPIERNIHPEFVIGGSGTSRETKSDTTFLVARKDQEDYLIQCGYAHVYSVGMPLVYLERPRVLRSPGSLLVMPAHSLPETTEEWDGEAYAEYVNFIAPRFTNVVACVHPSCISKGNWVSAFRRREIPLIAGADIRDSNSLLRMALLFMRFEYVTSNDWGSHLAFSAYFGAKPSVAGPRPEWRLEHYTTSAIYQNAPELLDILDEWYRDDFWRQRYPELHVNPWEAVSLQHWAAWQLGEQCKLSPNQLQHLLGWTPTQRLGTAFRRSTTLGKRVTSRILYPRTLS